MKLLIRSGSKTRFFHKRASREQFTECIPLYNKCAHTTPLRKVAIKYHLHKTTLTVRQLLFFCAVCKCVRFLFTFYYTFGAARAQSEANI